MPSVSKKLHGTVLCLRWCFTVKGSIHCVASRVGDDGLSKHVQLEVNQYRHIVQMMGHDVE